MVAPFRLTNPREEKADYFQSLCCRRLILTNQQEVPLEVIVRKEYDK